MKHVAVAQCLLVLLTAILAGCDQTTERVETQRPVMADAVAPDAASDSPATAIPTTKIPTHGEPRPVASDRLADIKPPPAKPAANQKPRDIDFDAIKFDIVKGDPFYRKMLTPEIEKLVDSKIKIRGFILPSFQQTGIKQFVLVRDNMECCFGPGAALYDCIVVDMKPGKTAEYSIRPVTVTGEFAVRELFDPDGKHLAIYHLEADAVQ